VTVTVQQNPASTGWTSVSNPIGFQIFNSGTAVTISSVTLTNASTITITTSGTVNNGAELRYMMDLNPANLGATYDGTTNLINNIPRDNTPLALPLEIHDGTTIGTYYTVTTTATNGTISPSNPSILSGTAQNFTQTPNSGYTFTGWSGTCGCTGTGTCDPTITAACTVVANYNNIYYIDYVSGSDSNNGTSTSTPFKYAPGMSGFGGTATLANGDTVILKGGSHWTFASTTSALWTLSATGLTLQGGQTLGTPWGTGYPILDGSGSTVGRTGIAPTSGLNMTINGIEIENMANTMPSGCSSTYSCAGGIGIYFSGVAVSGLTVENCYFNNDGDSSLIVTPASGSSNISINNNIFLNSGQGVVMYVSGSGNVDTVNIYQNQFQGDGGYNGYVGGVHGDGMIIGSACTTGNTCLTHVNIYQNKFNGNWNIGFTGMINLQNGSGGQPTSGYYGGDHVKIYDNQLTMDTDIMSGHIIDGFITIYSLWDDVQIYNNTMGGWSGGSNPPNTGILINDTATNIVIENNIFSGFAANSEAIGVGSATGTITSDYNLFGTDVERLNLFSGQSGAPDCRVLGTGSTSCYAKFGTEQHSIIANPQFVQAPDGTAGYGNWQLQSTSPAIGAGTNLSSIFTTDLLGNTWTTWGMGAYEYITSTIPTAICSGCKLSGAKIQ
jgi:hypothetical protein